MQIDARISKLAKNILKNSVQLQKGEKIYIEAFGASTKDFFNELIKESKKLGIGFFPERKYIQEENAIEIVKRGYTKID